MPKPPIAPFETFVRPVFHIGGDADQVIGIADNWNDFASSFESASAEVSTTDVSDFEGSEGETYARNLNVEFAKEFDDLASTHRVVAGAIEYYAMNLGQARREMGELKETASVDHAALVKAIDDYNDAEADAIEKRAIATQAQVAAAAAALTPGAVAAVAAAAEAESVAQAAEALQRAADVHYQKMKKNWEDDKREAQNIKDKLEEHVDWSVTAINNAEDVVVDDSLARDVIAAFKDEDWVRLLYAIADLPIVELSPVGTVAGILGFLGHSVMVMTGDATPESLWKEIGRLEPTKVGRINRFARGGWRILKVDEYLVESATGELGRQPEVISDLEPVDMATGAWIDYKIDVNIDGVLPLQVTRNLQSNFELGDCFGPQWKTNLDCSLEIHHDHVIMQAEDGAIVVFPMPPKDGSEVRSYSRPWLISFVDGAYRVRNIAAGVTYVFATCSISTDHCQYELQIDEKLVASNLYDIATIGHGLPKSSLGAISGLGMEIKLTAKVHRTGHWIEHDYDSISGLLKYLRRSDGTILEFEWDQLVRKLARVYATSEDDPTDRLLLISYEYDAYGRLRRVINSSGEPLSYSYDKQNRINGWTDRNGVAFRNRYDNQGRVVAQVGTGGMFANACVWLDDDGEDAPKNGKLCVAIQTAKVFKEDPKEIGDTVIPEILDRLETLPLVELLRSGGLKEAGLTGCGRDGRWTESHWGVADILLFDEFLGDVRPTVYRSTAQGDVWRTVKPSGACEDLEYNQYHQVTRKIMPSGGEYAWHYDDNGCVIEKHFPDGSVEIFDRDQFGIVTSITNRAGLVTHIESDITGSILSITSPNGAVTKFEYDWLPSGVIPTASIDFSGSRVEFFCDKAGRVLQRNDGHKTFSVMRDALGRIIKSTDRGGSETIIKYSPEGWRESVTYQDGVTEKYNYDSEGNLLKVIRGDKKIFQSSYTVFDRPLTREDGLDAVTTFLYNSQMEPVGVINADGLRWEFQRDLDGRLIAQKDYNRAETRFAYDVYDRWTTTLDALGNSTTSWFDILGRTVRQEFGEGEVTEWVYNQFNRVETVTNNHAQVRYHYDQWGKLEAEETLLSTGESYWTQVSLDLDDNAIHQTMKLPTGHELNQSTYRDDQGYPVQLNVEWAGTNIAELKFGYTGEGQRDYMTITNVLREFGFNERGQKISDVVINGINATPSDKDIIAGRQWGWKTDGSIGFVLDARAGLTEFDTDDTGRVLQVKKQYSSVDFSDEKYSFTPSSLFSTMTAGIKPKVDMTGVPRSPLEKQQSAREEKVRFEHNKPVQVGDIKYVYDAIGRIVETVTERASADPVIKKWDYVGSTGQVRQFWASSDSNRVWEYQYDGLRRRVAKICRNISSGEELFKKVFMYFGDELMAETVVNEPIRSLQQMVATGIELFGRVWINDPKFGNKIGQIDLTRPASTNKIKDRSPQAYFFLLTTDLAGAPQELIEPHRGEIVGKTQQSLLGRRIWQGEVTCPLLFDGQYADDESDWVYNRFRFYDPISGHYTSQDPLGVGPELASSQRYVLHPLTQTDFLGLEACSYALTDEDKKLIEQTTQWLYAERPDILHDWNAGTLSLTEGEQRYLEKEPKSIWAKRMYRGNAIDKAFKERIEKQDFYKDHPDLQITPRGAAGPDVVLRNEEGEIIMWWDITTGQQANAHISKYDNIQGYTPADQIIAYEDAGVDDHKHIVVGETEKQILDRKGYPYQDKAVATVVGNEKDVVPQNDDLVAVKEFREETNNRLHPKKATPIELEERTAPVAEYHNPPAEHGLDIRGFVERTDPPGDRVIEIDPELLRPDKEAKVKE